MGLIIIGLLLLCAAFAVPPILRARRQPPAVAMAAAVATGLLAVAVLVSATCVNVGDLQAGVIVKTIGENLGGSHVVAQHGEKGAQAEVLGPGWHVGYWPWIYDVQLTDTLDVLPGSMGLVTALDGATVAGGQTFAPAWDAPDQFLDGPTFLAKGGIRGPQLTVLPPGRYRYNQRLFAIDSKPLLVVDAGEVAVVKSNSGVDPAPGAVASDLINGVPLVERGQRGIWKKPLLPGSYYLHPQAYQVIKVQTTNRVYTYQHKTSHNARQAKVAAGGEADWAITVRSKDGFTFPAEVRVSCILAADDAPVLVAMLGDPDKVARDDQEDEDLSVLEAKVVLPLVRAILRNVAENMNALEFVNSRSKVESVATERMRTELATFRLKTDGVYIGNIAIDETEAGRQLLETQTKREVAVNQQQMFSQQKTAEESRATFIKAQAEAEQQKNLAEATYSVLVHEQEALARAKDGEGEAKYITITAEARAKAYEQLVKPLGQQGATQIELLRLLGEGKIQPGTITPQVLVGAGGSLGDALGATILRQQLAPAPATARPSPAP